MKEAKDCIRPRSTWLLACLGLCLCSVEIGCTGFGGLHSVGTWPPFAHLWERGPGSPSPENDTYAQAMRTHLGLDPKPADAAQGVAQGSEKGSRSQGAGGASPPGNAAAGDESALPKPNDGRQGVQVTLGQPEPLPGVLLASRPLGSRSSSGNSPDWRPAGTERGPGREPAAAGPVVVASAGPEPALLAAAEGSAVESPASGAALPNVESVPAHLALADQSETEVTRSELAAEATRTSSRADARLILSQAVAKLDGLDSYQVKMQRRERVGGVVQPEEDILLSIKRRPKAVRLEWTGGSSKGREVIFAPTLDAKMIYVHQPAAAVVVPSVKIAVDSPLVMKNSRHTIAEAGFDTILANLQKSQEQAAPGKLGAAGLDYMGLEKAVGVDRPCHHFVRRTPSGETWSIYLDPRSTLPRLVVAENAQGELLERYVYSDTRENPTELASAGAFDPAERWGEGKGLFSRIARAAAGANVPRNNASTKR